MNCFTERLNDLSVATYSKLARNYTRHRQCLDLPCPDRSPSPVDWDRLLIVRFEPQVRPELNLDPGRSCLTRASTPASGSSDTLCLTGCGCSVFPGWAMMAEKSFFIAWIIFVVCRPICSNDGASIVNRIVHFVN